MQNWISAFSWLNVHFLLMGLWVTIYISVISVILSFIIGSILGIIRYSKIKFVSKIVGFIIDIIRNVPLLLIIFFTYFGLPNFGLRPETIPAAVIAMTVFESSMIAEIVRSGIQSVSTGQMEGARSTGMSFVQALWHVVLPQAYKNMIPTIISQFVSLIKDTSLATIIVVPEMMQHAQVIYGQNSNYILPMFAALAVLYFIVCFTLSVIGNVIGKHLT
ncbi:MULTISPECIES: amino acid ABC transporter permease [Lactobacillus]|jgi:aspartate/glutamate/glutamine transport system permease protein|uniref:Glutamine ABC transporter, permease protein n=1 Tax=Lactobacillus apis TaxID=303541 RepID=A0A0F4LU64_9LACO|nr:MULTISPECIES: amino acid ABC transporter permease [Lactobacillus]AWM73355.1 amino acid ABC transporter permease [Lactobacillus apis]KJY61066.1 Glutamine ABC transporter, permease protein [Lactobacillus apis]MBC6360495.1 amino acid ABC transporter permease [Lactobacillus apis]MBH9984984.1 amino acid ABC transporter permease [Lactobacillus sp. M0390]MBI0022308.1 amino acid ABC transporter permease [Lactobacillus sp. W8172]